MQMVGLILSLVSLAVEILGWVQVLLVFMGSTKICGIIKCNAPDLLVEINDFITSFYRFIFPSVNFIGIMVLVLIFVPVYIILAYLGSHCYTRLFVCFSNSHWKYIKNGLKILLSVVLVISIVGAVYLMIAKRKNKHYSFYEYDDTYDLLIL